MDIVFKKVLFSPCRNAIRVASVACSASCLAYFEDAHDAFLVIGLMLFRLGQLRPPLFPWVRARFRKRDYRPDFFRFAPRVWCDDSYGAAHKRIWRRQKYLKNQLDFSNSVLRPVCGNKNIIISLGFSFKFDNAFFSLRFNLTFFYKNRHVLVLIRFPNEF